MESAALLAGLADGSLPPAEFSHRNHVRAAWQCLQEVGSLKPAAYRFRDILDAYTRRLGAEDKFHLTLTLAFMHLVNERRAPGEAWSSFEARNPALFTDARALIERHYSPERIESGRRVFVEPDRLTLP